jgi:RNA polymerase-binding transcription factor DksA
MSDNKAELLAKKQELEKRLEDIKKDLGRALSADSEERAVELENRDVLLEIARVSEEELESIKKKVQQLDE